MEAIVIGAGPAGLSSAIVLARLGMSVRVLEQRRELAGRVCGAFLSPEACLNLKWLGLLDKVQCRGVPTKGITITYAHKNFYLPFTQEPGGYALPRKILEEILIEEAVRDGAQVEFGARVEPGEKNEEDLLTLQVYHDKNRNEILNAPLVICAGGRFSSAFHAPLPQAQGWIGWKAEFKGVPQEPGDLSLHFFEKGYVGSLTFADGQTNVCGLIRTDLKASAGGDWEEVLSGVAGANPGLKRLLENAERISSFQSVPPLPFGRHISRNPSYFLTGDSQGVSEPFMGEGIGRALSSGPLLYSAFKKSGVSKSSIPSALSEMESLWEKRYSQRLMFGTLMRWCMGNGPALNLIFDFLSRCRFAQKTILNLVTKHGPPLPILSKKSL